MPQICPKIAQDISKICLRYAQALPKVWGFILRKWDKMSPGRVHQLGQYVSGEVHNAVGQFVLGTKCLLTLWNTLAGRQSSWQANGAGADTEVAFGFVCFCRLPCLCGQVHRAAPVVDQPNCLESQLLAWLWHKNLCCSHRNLVLNESVISGKPKIRFGWFLC